MVPLPPLPCLPAAVVVAPSSANSRCCLPAIATGALCQLLFLLFFFFFHSRLFSALPLSYTILPSKIIRATLNPALLPNLPNMSRMVQALLLQLSHARCAALSGMLHRGASRQALCPHCCIMPLRNSPLSLCECLPAPQVGQQVPAKRIGRRRLPAQAPWWVAACLACWHFCPVVFPACCVVGLRPSPLPA